MLMKDIAVIIPVYNGADMLMPCIDYVLQAGERIAEVIVVDDGSTDDTLRTALKCAESDQRIRVIHKNNNGSYDARITGIQASVSPYLAFADVDDRFYPGSLDMLAVLLELNDADVAMGSYREVTTLEPVITVREKPIVRSITDDQMWPRIMKWKTQEFVNYVWNKLYKRELLSDLKEADDINQGDDVLITCQAFLNVRKIVETTEPVYMYFQNPGSITREGFGKSDLNLIRVWDMIVSIMKEKKPDLLPMALFNRWRLDFTLITRLILVDDRIVDRKYEKDLHIWRKNLKEHWKDLVFSHAMPKNRELLVIALRFCFLPTKALLRLGRKMTKTETSVLLHSGDKKTHVLLLSEGKEKMHFHGRENKQMNDSGSQKQSSYERTD